MPTTDETVLHEVRSFLNNHHITESGRIGVAFSGGSDSLSLLIALCELCDKSSLHVIYVLHNLRSKDELAKELELNEKNCRVLGLPLHVLDLGDTVRQVSRIRKGGIEEAARYLRYEALFKECKKAGCSYLATAHNADDQLETVMMRLFQAASISALEGVRPIRFLEDRNIVLIRPVLTCTHAQLREYVQSHAMTWSEDSTNQEQMYLRNSIRHTLAPALLSIYPGAYQAVDRMGRRFGEVGQLLQSLTDEAVGRIRNEKDSSTFSLEWYLALYPAIRELVLFHLADRYSEEDRISGTFVQDLRQKLDASTEKSRWTIESGTHRIQCSQGFCVWSSMQVQICHFMLPLSRPEDTQEIEIGNGIVFTIQEYGKAMEDDSKLLAIDASKLDCPILRSVEESDEICLESGTVKVTKLLASYKIPRQLYPMVPILVDRSGLVAVFARSLGGRDRLAKRFKAPLAHRLTNIYSSNKRNHCSEI